jgi:hypothetical protein
VRTWRISGFGLLAAAAVLISSCTQPAAWTGFVYPDANNLTVSAEIGQFDSFEECRTASIRTLGAFAAIHQGTFECGRSCRWHADLGLKVCAETRD